MDVFVAAADVEGGVFSDPGSATGLAVGVVGCLALVAFFAVRAKKKRRHAARVAKWRTSGQEPPVVTMNALQRTAKRGSRDVGWDGDRRNPRSTADDLLSPAQGKKKKKTFGQKAMSSPTADEIFPGDQERKEGPVGGHNAEEFRTSRLEMADINPLTRSAAAVFGRRATLRDGFTADEIQHQAGGETDTAVHSTLGRRKSSLGVSLQSAAERLSSFVNQRRLKRQKEEMGDFGAAKRSHRRSKKRQFNQTRARVMRSRDGRSRGGGGTSSSGLARFKPWGNNVDVWKTVARSVAGSGKRKSFSKVLMARGHRGAPLVPSGQTFPSRKHGGVVNVASAAGGEAARVIERNLVGKAEPLFADGGVGATFPLMVARGGAPGRARGMTFFDKTPVGSARALAMERVARRLSQEERGSRGSRASKHSVGDEALLYPGGSPGPGGAKRGAGGQLRQYIPKTRLGRQARPGARWESTKLHSPSSRSEGRNKPLAKTADVVNAFVGARRAAHKLLPHRKQSASLGLAALQRSPVDGGGASRRGAGDGGGVPSMPFPTRHTPGPHHTAAGQLATGMVSPPGLYGQSPGVLRSGPPSPAVLSLAQASMGGTGSGASGGRGREKSPAGIPSFKRGLSFKRGGGIGGVGTGTGKDLGEARHAVPAAPPTGVRYTGSRG